MFLGSRWRLAKDDIADEVTKLTGGAPRGGKKKPAKPGQAGRGDLDWSLSDQESLPDLAADEDDGVRHRLADLKRQTAGEPARRKDEPAGKRKRKRRERSHSKQISDAAVTASEAGRLIRPSINPSGYGKFWKEGECESLRGGFIRK